MTTRRRHEYLAALVDRMVSATRVMTHVAICKFSAHSVADVQMYVMPRNNESRDERDGGTHSSAALLASRLIKATAHTITANGGAPDQEIARHRVRSKLVLGLFRSLFS